MENHTPFPAPAFNGLYARGKKENCPADHAIELLNVKLINDQIETRDGINLDVTIAQTVLRAYLYQRFNEVTRLIFLGANGNFYDASISVVVPIFTVIGATDFGASTLYNRVYITPHNGVRGIENASLYVYDGTTARVAAGVPPSSTAITPENSPTDGHVEAGVRAYAYVYETSSGYLTKPSGFATLESNGTKKVLINDIINGPSGTVAKHIVATKFLDNFLGDFENQEYYFVPDGEIPDNVTTSITIDFYDADLIDSADYLLDNLSTIPAGVGLTIYNDRLLIWGEYTNPNVVRASYVQEPEVFSETEGFATVASDDGGGSLQSVRVLRNSLYLFKNTRGSVTTDTGANIAFWRIDKIDSDLGTVPHGIAGLTNLAESILFEKLFIGNEQGLWLFNGYFPEIPLSWKIEDYWERINTTYLYKMQIVIDSTSDRIYISVPLDAATECSHLFVACYENGLSAEDIKWTIWTFPYRATTILLNINSTTKKRYLQFGSIDQNVYKQEEDRRNDNNQAIVSYYRFAFAPPQSFNQLHFCGVRTKAIGVGVLDLTVYSEDDVVTVTPVGLTLASTCRFPLQRKFNFSGTRASIKVGTDTLSEWFLITAACLYATEEFSDRPEST